MQLRQRNTFVKREMKIIIKKRTAEDKTETDIVPEKNIKTVPVKERKQQRVGSKIMFNLILTVIMMYHWQEA
jgi:hypothetical protein